MEALIHAFWRILLLRSGPQSIPASAPLMWLMLLLHFTVGTLYAQFMLPFSLALSSALVSTLSMVVVVHGLLLLFQKHARYLQSLTALAACEALLLLPLLALSLLYYQGGEGEELRAMLAILSLIMVGWNVALAAHIFKHALSVSSGLGFLYSVVYLIIAITLGDMVSAAGVAG